MQPLAEWPRAVRRALRGVFFDIDDTLTTDGRLTAEAYNAMERLQRAGLHIVPVTGRPAGWCDHIARMWPIDGVVGENGAFYFWYDGTGHRIERRYVENPAVRKEQRARLHTIGEEIVAKVPGAAFAADQAYRDADLAIDFCEDVPRLADDAIDRIVAIMESHDLTAKVSSIHVNGWYGTYDKLGMSQTLMRERHGVDLPAEREHYAFIGDSPNDAPMFEFFPHAIGVANIRDFGSRLATAPRYVSAHRAGRGFCETADAILVARIGT